MFRERQGRFDDGAMTSLRPLTTYSRTIHTSHFVSSIIYFFLNRRTKRPTILGWFIVAAISLWTINCAVLKSLSKRDAAAEIIQINPKFHQVPAKMPVGPQDDEFRRIAEENRHGIKPLVLPLFDQNKHLKNNAKSLGETHENQDGHGQHRVSRPQPKSFPVKLLHEPKASCDEDTTVLMVVLSRAENVMTRRYIREAWGTYEEQKFGVVLDVKWKTIFVFGRTSKFDDEVSKESAESSDILQGEFEDSAHEDTRKFMMAAQWTSEHLKACSHLRFVLKTEDNIFHNMASIGRWLHATYPQHVTEDEHLYVGKLIRKDRPIRDVNNPLYVPAADYGREFFPDFIEGPVYLFSFYSLKKLAEVMPSVTPIAMEDAFVGLLAERSGVVIPQHNDHLQMLSKPTEECHLLHVSFVYDVKSSDHLIVFRKTQETLKSKRCGGGDERVGNHREV